MNRLAFTHADVAGLRAGPIRAVTEGLAGFAVLLIFDLAVSPASRFLGHLYFVLAWLWIVLWPAYRLRPVQRGVWWTRLPIGLGRGFLIGLSLGAGSTLIWSVGGLIFGYDWHFNWLILGILLAFFVVRGAVVALASTRQYVRGRLRRRLMVSHLVAMVLTLVTLTGLGTVVAIATLSTSLLPNATVVAPAVARELRLRDNAVTINPARAADILNGIEQGRRQVGGETFLARIIPAGFTPGSMVVLDLHGRVVASAQNLREQGLKVARPGTYLYPAAVFIGLRRDVAREKTVVLHKVPGLVLGNEYGASQIENAAGKPVGIVILSSNNLGLGPAQIIRAAVTLFSLSTILLVVVTGIPMLMVAALISYLMARGLTRQLEEVSQVANAIASGDLARRAPVDAQDETGRLAESVNQMAENLGSSMAEQERARSQAEDALRSQRALVANVSHELRTPLAVLRAHLESLVMRAPVPAGASSTPAHDIAVSSDTINALQTETERLSTLIDDLFALSRVEAGALEVRQEPVDVATVVDEIATTMRPLAQQDGMVALTVEAAPGLPPALADPDRLRQIIANLVRNAVRHTPEGGIVALAVDADGPYIAVSVVDTGEGIPAEHLPHIFERFYRGDEARTPGAGGAGLGLAIVREFVERMGGRIEVSSEPGEGSVFRVLLPQTVYTGLRADIRD